VLHCGNSGSNLHVAPLHHLNNQTNVPVNQTAAAMRRRHILA